MRADGHGRAGATLPRRAIRRQRLGVDSGTIACQKPAGRLASSVDGRAYHRRVAERQATHHYIIDDADDCAPMARHDIFDYLDISCLAFLERAALATQHDLPRAPLIAAPASLGYYFSRLFHARASTICAPTLV